MITHQKHPLKICKGRFIAALLLSQVSMSMLQRSHLLHLHYRHLPLLAFEVLLQMAMHIAETYRLRIPATMVVD